MRPATLAALALLAALPAAAPALAGDEAAEAAARLEDKWREGLETLPAEQIDANRAALLEPVAASASPVAFAKILAVARDRVEAVFRAKERLKSIEEREKRKADNPDAKPSADPGAARAGVEADAEAVRDKERLPKVVAVEERWLPRLGEGAARVLEALSDSDFDKVAAPKVREALGDALEGWGDWVASALGRSRKERTARLVFDAADDAIKDFRKALVARAAPAKELDKVNDDIDRLVLPYLEQRQKAGDFSGQMPASLVPDALRRDQSRLESELFRITVAMESALTRRATARRVLAGVLASAPEDARTRLLDAVEKQCTTAKDFEARAFGIGALGLCPGDRAMKALREAAKDPHPDVVVAVCEALSGRDEAEVIEILGAAVLDARWQVRSAAAGALAATGRSGAVPPLIEALRKAEGRTVDDVEAALVKLTRKRFPPVAKAWDDWWAKDGKEFKGPRDPGYGEAAGAGDAGGDGAARSNGDRISFYGIETNSKRVLFVLDFSGSMNFAGSESDAKRHKIDVLKEEMRKTLAGMPDGAKFGMVGFSSDVRVWRKGLPPALRDQKTARDAMDWVEKQPVVGSTNIYDALETAFRSMGVGLSADKSYEPLYDTIFFMTDGVPTSGKVTDKAVLLGEVKRWNAAKRVRIHVIGMGGKSKSPHPGGQDDVDKDFLQKLADQSGGECVFR